MGKLKTIDTFFKRSGQSNRDASNVTTSARTRSSPEPSETGASTPPQCSSKRPRLSSEQVDAYCLERDPGVRPMIWEFPVNKRDEVRRAYLRAGPYQPILDCYPFSSDIRFDASWLEYSREDDAMYCLPCYLFGKESPINTGSNAFIENGFRNWKNVNSGNECPLLNHIGEGLNSFHLSAVNSCDDLMKQSQHIDRLTGRKTSEEIESNRFILETSIDCIRWLAFQACTYGWQDESLSSNNRGNFIELLKLLGSVNDRVQNLVLDNAPSEDVQKEILHIIATKVRKSIREEIGDAKFCLFTDDTQDASEKEPIAIVLRFVDLDGLVQERFFDLVYARDISAMTIRKELMSVLYRYNLQIENIRGQVYDGDWDELKALFLNGCPRAYYVHCFARKLQLVLVAASRGVPGVHYFFKQLTRIVNIVGASWKQHDQLQEDQTIEIANMVVRDELEIGRRASQVGTSKGDGDTQWDSYFNSICSLIRLLDATCTILENIIDEGATSDDRGEAYCVFEVLLSFEFVFILHLMKEIMGITSVLCQALLLQPQQILNSMNLVSPTKLLLQQLRDCGWCKLLENVKEFCEKHEIEVPDMSSQYIFGGGRSRPPNVTVEHHYRVEVFLAAIDSQTEVLNSRFNEQTVELLTLSTALDPRDNFKSFNIEEICKLAKKFYPIDFSEEERILLKSQLYYYGLEIPNHVNFKDIGTLSELCQRLKETGKSSYYSLIDRLIRLVLTLPVHTPTTKRTLSAMKTVKTRFKSNMEDEFLADSLVLYIEKEIATTFSTSSIIDDFASSEKR